MPSYLVGQFEEGTPLRLEEGTFYVIDLVEDINPLLAKIAQRLQENKEVASLRTYPDKIVFVYTEFDEETTISLVEDKPDYLHVKTRVGRDIDMDGLCKFKLNCDYTFIVPGEYVAEALFGDYY